MSTYIAIPAEALESWLVAQKFEKSVQWNEIVYTRKSARNPEVLMKVYTSIRVGQGTVRSSGKDAIRVCVVFDNGRKSFGIGKFKPVFRVHSVESVLSRLKERLVEAANRANEWIDKNNQQISERVNSLQNGRNQDLYWKNEFAKREAAQERRGFLSDPDFQNFLADEPPPELFSGE